MSTFHSTSGKLGVDVDNPKTAQDFALGECTMGVDGTKWMFVQAGGAVAQYDCVGITEAFQAIAMTKGIADDGHIVAFAQAAFADNEYGWVACEGADANFKVNVLADCAADVALYTTATAGKLDDDSTTQTQIQGAVIVTLNGGSTAAVAAILTNPHTI